MTRDDLVERALAGANHLRWLISKHQHETIVPEIREACAEWSKQAAAIEALAALPPEPVGLRWSEAMRVAEAVRARLTPPCDESPSCGRAHSDGPGVQMHAAQCPRGTAFRADLAAIVTATLGKPDPVAEAEREVVEAAVRFYRHEVRTAAELDSTTAALLDARAKAEQTKGTK